MYFIEKNINQIYNTGHSNFLNTNELKIIKSH